MAINDPADGPRDGPAASGLDVGGLFDAHARDLFRYLSARAGAGPAEDLVGEKFLAAHRSWRSYDSERGSPRAWLYGIASTLLRRHHRDQARRFDALERLAALAADGAPDASPDADRRLDSATHARRLVPHLRRLDPTDLDILLLHAWAGLEPTEIAAVLDRPAGTVRSRLSRLRKALRAVDIPADVDRTPIPITTGEQSC
ncbi:RNA polymerase sigma factor [Nakamurella sp.]|uniref:RNA polymerase sigma factor n=1 Tax=Nakamurella sp. TaxID=1869182 RepID=UPI003784BAF9